MNNVFNSFKDGIGRYEILKEYNLDTVLLAIKNGKIDCGKYSDMVKVDKDFKLKDKEVLFNDN